MRLRIYIDETAHSAETLRDIERIDFKNQPENDLMFVKPTDFRSVIGKVDLVIKPEQTPFTADDVYNSMVKIWRETGGRGGIMNARGAFLSDADFPEYCKAREECLRDLK